MRPFDPAILNLFPFHRSKEKRTQSLTLDELIDDYRRLKTLTNAEFDFLLMSYRYEHLFQKFLSKFTKAKVKPAELTDLLRLAFAALLTRDEENIPPLTHALVESSKEIFGPHTAPITNAFCRNLLREKDSILNSLKKNPEIILGPSLQKRWAKNPELISRFANKVTERPKGGIWGLTKSNDGLVSGLIPKTFEKGMHLAMSAGSCEFIKWAAQITNEHFINQAGAVEVLDMCSAPGGKLIAFLEMTKIEIKNTVAVDSKFKRIERLKENLSNWTYQEKVNVQMHDWTGKAAGTSPVTITKKWDVVFADLPCTGLGTLASRPDILLENWGEDDTKLYKLQTTIVEEGIKRLNPGSLFFVSICSSDPSEIEHLSKLLGVEPQFKATLSEINSEEITGWKISK